MFDSFTLFVASAIIFFLMGGGLIGWIAALTWYKIPEGWSRRDSIEYFEDFDDVGYYETA